MNDVCVCDDDICVYFNKTVLYKKEIPSFVPELEKKRAFEC